MGYRIFYSYQSDIDKKLNKKFIREAINEAIIRITDYDIDPLIEGFYGIGGNPPLADKMLQLSQSSDIFIGDVTFTSSKVWHNPLDFVEGEKSNLIEIRKGDLKPSPNPNVLIETGYSWALKGYDRTILVMNTAFGQPENLPVDMGDKRHPIKYNLSFERFNIEAKKKKEFEALCNALYNAILTVIKSDAEYQRKRWAPLELHKDWYQKDFTNIYHPTNKAKEIIKKLRIALEDTNRPQRIIGPKNSGKTRLVYELYKGIDETLQEHENLSYLLYFDLKGDKVSDKVREKFQDLKNSYQRKVLVLDNCPIDVHREVYNQLPADGHISLLTIGDNENGEGASFFIDLDFANETIEKISYEIGNPRNTNFILDSSKGNLREAIAMIGKIPEGEVGLSQDYQTKWQQILGPKIYSLNTLSVLEELSLFTHVGYTDRHEKQSEILLLNTEINSKDELSQIIDDLAQIGIVKITGDSIILEAFIEELAASRLAKLTNENLDSYFEKLIDLGLSKQFSNRLIELNKLIGTKTLIESLTSENGLFRKDAFINSEQGSRILMNLAEIEPVVVIEILNDAFSSLIYTDLKDKKSGRRNIVWALEKLVYRTETFKDAAKLLFKLAVAENEEIGNNATAQFCQLFQLYLPATTVSLEVRIKLIGELISIANEEDEKAVINKALDRALMTRGFTRMGGAEQQAGVKFEDYPPQNKEEILGYWKSVIELLMELNAFDILVKNFSSQLRHGNSTAMIDSINRVIKNTGKIDKDLRQQFEYVIEDQRELSQEIVSQVQVIINQFSNNSIREQLEYKVALAPYSTFKTESGKRINSSEEKAIELALHLIRSNDEEWLNEIDILLKNEQRLTFPFGKEIAKHNSKFEKFIDVVIEKLSAIPFEQQNNSLIVGYCSEIEDKSYVRNIIDRFLANEKIAFHAIQLTRSLDIHASDLDKLKNLINDHPNFVVSLQFFKLQNLTKEELRDFIEWVKTIKPYGLWIAIGLIQSSITGVDQLEAQTFQIVEALLMKPGILKGEDMPAPYAMQQYVDLFKLINTRSPSIALIKFLASEIILVSKEYSISHEYYLKDILDILLKDHWEPAWEIIGKQIIEQDFYGWYNLKDILVKVRTIKPENLLTWMEQFPQDAPQKAIEFINYSIVNEDEVVWNPLVSQMFDKFFSNQEFFISLSRALGSFSSIGSVIPYYEERVNLLRLLLDHKNEEIKSFASSNINYFERMIAMEKRREANNTLE
jgi:hypothetical protein